MKRGILGVIATVIVLAVWVVPLWAGPMVLKVGTVEPPQGWALVNVVKPFLAKVENDAGGTVTFKVYAGGTLGRNPTKYVKHVRDGVMDLGWVINAYQPGVFPDDEVVNVPFVAKNPLEATVAINNMVGKGMLRGYDSIVPLGVYVLNQYAVHSTFPIKKPADLKGKKVRAAGRLQQGLVEALGAGPVGIPAPKIAETVSRGVVDGVILEWNGMKTFRIVDLTKYHCMVSFGATIISFIMNKDVFNKLPPQAKAAFEKHMGMPFGKDWGVKQTKNEKAIMESVKNNPKHTIYVPSASEMEQWKAIMGPVVEKWEKEHPKGKVLLDTYKAEIKKYRAGK
ncbi:MAG: TRAP transporter substrate-binding protein [Deltaproteobacteria bacterium]|nr:TRAP transporter substrate-binding protein [Deltaproteobacteria bacterium]